METDEVAKEREVEKRCEELRKDGTVINRTMREWVAQGVAAEMIQRAKELTKEGVTVEAPVEARQAVAAASSKAVSSRSPTGRVWRPNRNQSSSESSNQEAKTAYKRNWSRKKEE
eukprot:12219724-Karenia_brevis.AAC.1